MESQTTEHHAAAVLNAAYLVRFYSRPGQAHRRARAIDRMAAAVRKALADAPAAEPVLYAIAVGLYEKTDARFFR